MVSDTIVSGGGGRMSGVRGRVDRLVDDPRVRWVMDAAAITLAFYFIVQLLWPAPFGIVVRGIITGSLTAMVAFGISLIYRANRIINFAQADLGAVPATLAVLLIVAVGVPFVPAVLTGIAAGALLGGFIEFVLIRPFAKAPRLILTVATIGISQTLVFAEFSLPSAFDVDSPPQNVPPPFDLSFSIGSGDDAVYFNANSVLAVVAVPLVIAGLWAFFRYTHVGIAVRAAAERTERASLLGVPVRRINTLVWVIASTLATIGLILRAGVVGLPFGSAVGIPILVQVLTACVIARMERLTVMFIVSVAIGIVEQVVVFSTGAGLLVDPIVFGIVLVGLLVQRAQPLSRLQDAAVSSWQAVKEVREVPRELRHLPEVKWVRRAAFGVLAVVLLFAPPVLGEGRTDLAIGLMVYALVGVSLVVLTGWSGQVSLGQFAFVGLGAAVGGWVTLHLHWDILLSLLASGLVGALASVLMGLPALRIRGLFLAVTTLAFAQAAYSYFLNKDYVPAIPGGDEYIPRRPLLAHIDLSSETRYYYFCLAVFLITVAGVTRLRRSRNGRLLIAVRENERGVQSYGLNITAAKLMAFAISGFVAALAGGLYVHLQTGFLNTSFLPVNSMNVFVMAVIGGLGSITGAILGAVYIQSLTWFRSLFPTAVQNIMPFLGGGLGLVLILMFLPGGIGSLVFKTRDRILKRVADRRGIVVPSLIADLRTEPSAPEAEEEVAVETAAEAMETTAAVGSRA